jgi:UDP-N-acetyl-D-glucosamine dehydrogenase
MSTDLSSIPDVVALPTQPGAAPAKVIDLLRAGHFRFDVALVGLGYVGLPTALAFHAAQSRVLGFDVSAHRLDTIREGRVDLLDSDQSRLHRALGDTDTFTLTEDGSHLAKAAAVIIAVPTPVDEHLLPDLAMLRSACATVVANAVAGQVIIMTSTTYVGCTQEMLVVPLTDHGFTVGEDIYVAFSPERIDPGNDRHAHEDVARVVGGATEECTRRAMAALGTYAANLYPVSSTATAEMTKLFENTFRAVNIALANELAEISRSLKLDVVEVIEAAATKPYGFMAFMPGPGVGGHCIPCDPHYLLWQLRRKRLATPVIEQTMQAIAARPLRVVDRVSEVLSIAGRGISNATILVLGVAYKPDVQDMRESPALEIIAGLRVLGATVDFHDPLVREVRLPDGDTLNSVPDPQGYLADLVLVHTLHRCMDLSWLEDAPLILDTSYRLRDLPQRFAL